MRVSAIVFSGLAAVATATTTSWGTDPASAVYTSTSTYSSSSTSSCSGWGCTSSTTTTTTTVKPYSTSTSYDPTWSVWTSSSSTKSPVSTSTSYDPTWSVWSSSSSVKSPVSTSASYDPTWAAWSSSSTVKSPATTTPCPAWTGGAAPPAYFTNLPDSIKSALPSWTGAPPSDYCLYTSWMQSFSSCTAPAAVAATTLATTGAAKATGTVYGSWSSTGVAPIATFKGAANANAASYAVAGLAAAAALVMA